MLTSVYRILLMTHQGNLYSQGTNLNNYILETVFSDKNTLGLLTKLDPKYIQMYLDNKRRMRLTVMNSAIIVKPRRNM